MLIVYVITMFLSASLLFVVQPMFARMVLPMLGGAPAVWNTAQVFYQAALLAGYAYAHLTTKWLGVRRQAIVHLVLLSVPLLLLPIGIPDGWTPPSDVSPIPWLLLSMLVSVGLPFFVVSTTSPLLQKWFAGTGHRSAADPYFLYAASNIGSMLALLGYPFLIEPRLGIVNQSWLWAIGYAVLVVMMLCCAVVLWRAPRTANRSEATEPAQGSSVVEARMERVTNRRRLRWVLLAFVPSSLMLSVTTYLSTDIAAIPLLWVIPLALYLLTFILVFASKPPLPHWMMVRALPIVLLPLVIVMAARATQPIVILIPVHLLTFFVATMVCHGEIARDRPSTHYLTEFYLWMSFGGALGGIFNALIAPQIFTSVAEYPLMLVLACLLMPRASALPTRRTKLLDLGMPGVLAAVVVVLIMIAQAGEFASTMQGFGLMFGIPAFVCFSFSRRPLRFALGVGVILLLSRFYIGAEGQVLYAERSFFGVSRVGLGQQSGYHLLMQGSTLHGLQSLDPARSREPLSYYYKTGPLGQVFETFNPSNPDASIGVVGLGTGAIACYSTPGQQVTFFEIDPVVEEIARDPRYFTFLRDCGQRTNIVLGDARLSLEATDQQFDMLILDAYSSDSIPMHLVTREALKLYADRLAPNGRLVFHISNRHLDLDPVLGNLAQDAGLFGIVRNDDASAEEAERGKSGSQWVVLARSSEDLGTLVTDQRWKPLRTDAQQPVWTDQFGSILSAFRWR